MATPCPAATPPALGPALPETAEALWGMGTSPRTPTSSPAPRAATERHGCDGHRHRGRRHLLLIHACFVCLCGHPRLQGQADPKEVLPVRREKCCVAGPYPKDRARVVLVGSSSLLSYTAVRQDRRRVEDVADAMKQLEVFLGRLQQILGNMVNSVTDMTHGVNGIACDANAMLLANKDDPTPDIVADLTKTNTTIATMKQAIHDMKSNVEKYRKRAESDQVQDMINYAIALMVSLPFIIYIIHTCLGVACTACRSVMPEGKVKKMSKSCAWCHLNTGACWAGGPGLILALVIFVALFIVSIALADFCYVGPGPVMLAAARDNNETSALTYYLECAGENPGQRRDDAMAAAVSNLTDATASLTNLPTCGGPQYGARGLQPLRQRGPRGGPGVLYRFSYIGVRRRGPRLRQRARRRHCSYKWRHGSPRGRRRH